MLANWKENRSERKISLIELELLVESARIAPSASNRQPWKFVVVKDKRFINHLRSVLEEERPVSGFIVGLGVKQMLIERGLELPFWMIDLPIAISHISIMAGALGMAGKVYMNIPESRVNSLLGVDDKWRTVGIVGFR